MATIAVIAAGAMGAAVGGALAAGRGADGGHRVVTSLAGRSAATAARAAEHGLADAGVLGQAVAGADVVLSILPPAEAVGLARAVADVGLKDSAVYVDCNAVAPMTAVAMGEVITGGGVVFADGGIIGPPPQVGRRTDIYVSGPDVDAVLALNGDEVAARGLVFRAAGDAVGDASALKMCHAAIGKGLAAIGWQALTAAKAYGVDGALAETMAAHQGPVGEAMWRTMPNTVGKAYRFVGEMEEIAATFSAVGLAPEVFEGAARTYEQVTAGWRDGALSEDDAAEVLAAALARRLGARRLGAG